AAAWDDEGLCQRAVRALKARFPQLGVITDVALDPYTAHGQDGLVDADGYVMNDATGEARVQQAQARELAGAHVYASGDMRGGRSGAMPLAVEVAGVVHHRILTSTAKYASVVSGPVRDAVGSATGLGKADKSTYQMDPGNNDEAL